MSYIVTHDLIQEANLWLDLPSPNDQRSTSLFTDHNSLPTLLYTTTVNNLPERETTFSPAISCIILKLFLC